jgi:uncharacterized protein with von Willebrand factor type A (vWA) domain
MLLRFFLCVRDHKVPASLRELLDLLQALRSRLVFADIEAFYFMSRMCLVKDEKYYDRFDQAFASFFDGVSSWQAVFDPPANAVLLRSTLKLAYPKLSENELANLLAEYKKTVSEMVGTPASSKERKSSEVEDQVSDKDGAESASEERMNKSPGERKDSSRADQEEEGGSEEGGDGEGENGESGEGFDGEEGEGENGEKGEGSDGDEGEGENGEQGEGSGEKPGTGVRTDLESESQRSATRVWELRQFEDYDPKVELGTRNIKMALRRLRKFTRTAADLELDLNETIRCTARNGGILDIREIPERHNAVKVLLFLDVGGSMDDHVELCAQLFSAARSEFKHLEYFYFHNFIYESVWTDNERRGNDRVLLVDLLRKYGRDYKLVFVGDAQMGRHEIAEKGGSVEHFNAEPGQYWMQNVLEAFRKVIWINPISVDQWKDSYTTEMIRRIMDDQMYHLSVEGIEQAMKYLVR